MGSVSAKGQNYLNFKLKLPLAKKIQPKLCLCSTSRANIPGHSRIKLKHNQSWRCEQCSPRKTESRGGWAGMSCHQHLAPLGKGWGLWGPQGRQGWVSRCCQAVGIPGREEEELGRQKISQIQRGCYHWGNSSPPSVWTQADGSASPNMGTHPLLLVSLQHTFPLGLTGL